MPIYIQDRNTNSSISFHYSCGVGVNPGLNGEWTCGRCGDRGRGLVSLLRHLRRHNRQVLRTRDGIRRGGLSNQALKRFRKFFRKVINSYASSNSPQIGHFRVSRKDLE